MSWGDAWLRRVADRLGQPIPPSWEPWSRRLDVAWWWAWRVTVVEVVAFLLWWLYGMVRP